MRIVLIAIVKNEENINFNAAGCVPQSENFKIHVKKINPSCDIDIVKPGDDQSIFKIIL